MFPWQTNSSFVIVVFPIFCRYRRGDSSRQGFRPYCSHCLGLGLNPSHYSYSLCRGIKYRAVSLILLFLFSITHLVNVVEIFLQMRVGVNLFLQLGFGPAVLCSSLQVPAALIHGQIGFQDDDVLCPTELHGQ